MSTTNSKLTQIKLEIEGLENELIGHIKDRDELESALANTNEIIADKLRVRLVNIAAMTALEQEKFK